MGVCLSADMAEALSRLVSIRSSCSAPMIPFLPANTLPMRFLLRRAVSITPQALALMTAVTPPDWA
jgi:hypothetical protein